MSDEDSYHYSDNDDDDDNHDAGGGGGDEEESFEYTDEDEDTAHDGEDGDSDNLEIQLENAYYNAKAQRDTDKIEACNMFEQCIALESKAENLTNSWTFKCLKQMMKIQLSLGDYTQAKNLYQQILECITSEDREGITPNAMEKGVNGMLDRVTGLFQSSFASGGSSDAMMEDGDEPKGNPQALAKFVYDATLTLFHPKRGSRPNERLWFKTNLKYGQLLYENYETDKLEMVIQDLLLNSKDSLSADSSSSCSSSTTSTQLMEIYALQIQLYSRLKDNQKLKEILFRAMNVHGGIPHPRTIALIQELGGKMHAASGDFEAANTAFFQAFKSYDEAGDVARLRCLKYLVIASMLHASKINPFDSQEVRPYKNDPEIVSMTNLVEAFHNSDIVKFESILSQNQVKIMKDEFIREYISDLLKTIRTKVLVQVIQPYSRISLQAISKALNGVPLKDVESLLILLILDGRLDGRIDEVNGILYKNNPNNTVHTISEAQEEETTALKKVTFMNMEVKRSRERVVTLNPQKRRSGVELL